MAKTRFTVSRAERNTISGITGKLDSSNILLLLLVQMCWPKQMLSCCC